jgi:DNA-directed RNA polymerase beta subunit
MTSDIKVVMHKMQHTNATYIDGDKVRVSGKKKSDMSDKEFYAITLKEELFSQYVEKYGKYETVTLTCNQDYVEFEWGNGDREILYVEDSDDKIFNVFSSNTNNLEFTETYHIKDIATFSHYLDGKITFIVFIDESKKETHKRKIQNDEQNGNKKQKTDLGEIVCNGDVCERVKVDPIIHQKQATGDRISQRHSQMNTVSHVLPGFHIPNPHAIPSRMTLGHYLERNGNVCKKVKVNHTGGQMSTVGSMLPKTNMPYSTDGLLPDIIVNSHEIPQRMTLMQYMECIGNVSN